MSLQFYDERPEEFRTIICVRIAAPARRNFNPCNAVVGALCCHIFLLNPLDTTIQQMRMSAEDKCFVGPEIRICSVSEQW